MTKNEKIFNAIQNAFKNNLCEWDDIIQSVEQAKIPVKNWMDVRGVLQWMINTKMIVRIKNVHKEQYAIIEKVIV